MNVHRLTPVLIFVICLIGHISDSIADIAEAMKTVVKITTKLGGQGTGFIVGYYGGHTYVLTASHVVEKMEKDELPQIFFNRNPTGYKSTVITFDEQDSKKGLTLLQTEYDDKIGCYPLAAEEPQQNTKFTSISYPNETQGNIFTTPLYFSSRVGSDWLFTGSGIKDGHSGSPVIDEQNKTVVAMIVSASKDIARTVNAITTIKNFLEGTPNGKELLQSCSAQTDRVPTINPMIAQGSKTRPLTNSVRVPTRTPLSPKDPENPSCKDEVDVLVALAGNIIKSGMSIPQKCGQLMDNAAKFRNFLNERPSLGEKAERVRDVLKFIKTHCRY